MRLFIILLFLIIPKIFFASNILTLMSDFGMDDGAVASMRGVALGVDRKLQVMDITHNIDPYNIRQAAYRLCQTVEFWPKGTVFVCIVDPGVGTERRSIVIETISGHYFVGPDNGIFTLVANKFGIKEVREIDESVNRLKGSEKSYTFFGRDLYAYTGAKLASGKISFEQVGKKISNDICFLKIKQPELKNNSIFGNITVLDVQYGNVWTDISFDLFSKLNIKERDMLLVCIKNNGKVVFKEKVVYVNTFGGVSEGVPLIYFNSLMELAIALNQGNFAEKYCVEGKEDWTISVEKIDKNI